MALNFFHKKKEDVPKNVPARIQKMTNEELIKWVDTLALQLGQSIDAWRYHDGPLEDCVLIGNTVSQVLHELSERLAKKAESK